MSPSSHHFSQSAVRSIYSRSLTAQFVCPHPVVPSLPHHISSHSLARAFHSSSRRQAAGAGGPNTAKNSSTSWKRSQSLDAHFIRFQLDLPRAQQVYQSWAARQRFAPNDLTKLERVVHTDVAYLPFYMFDVEVATTFSGKVGFKRTVSHYNPTTKRMESYTTTDWRSVPPLQGVYTASYTPDLPQLQIYGAFKYKWEPIQVLKTPISRVRVLTPSQMSPSDFRDGREVDVFEMKLATAQGRVKEFIRAQETAKGERLLMEKYNADEASVAASIELTSFRIRRVYQPAYVFHLQHLGQEFEVVVNGSTGEVWGQYIYSAEKVGSAAMLAGSAAYLAGAFAHVVHLSPTTYVLGVLLPSIVAGLIGKYWATVRQFLREARRVGDKEADAAIKAESAGAEWTAAGGGEQRRTEQRYEQQYRQYTGGGQQQQYQRAAPPRPVTPQKSHYEILGLPPTATLDDIRTAFRAKSFQYHPDVNKGKEEWANERFREILEAYQVLRDPKKRAQYDQGRR